MGRGEKERREEKRRGTREERRGKRGERRGEKVTG